MNVSPSEMGRTMRIYGNVQPDESPANLGAVRAHVSAEAARNGKEATTASAKVAHNGEASATSRESSATDSAEGAQMSHGVATYQ